MAFTSRSIPPFSAIVLAAAGFGATLGPAAVAAKLSRSLATAVDTGDSPAVAKILARGGDPNGWVSGESLLGRALANRRADLVALLLARGADANGFLANGETPLLRAVSTREEGMVRLLLEAGASVDLRSTWGELPLHRAAASGDAPIVGLLLSRGADPLSIGPDARSAALVAAEASHPQVAELLRRHADAKRRPSRM